MMQQPQPHKLVSPATGLTSDELDTVSPVRLKHVLPSTLFSISLADLTSYTMRSDGSIFDNQQFEEWASLEQFCEQTGYTTETTLDAWCGSVLNPDLESSDSTAVE